MHKLFFLIFGICLSAGLHSQIAYLENKDLGISVYTNKLIFESVAALNQDGKELSYKNKLSDCKSIIICVFDMNNCNFEKGKYKFGCQIALFDSEKKVLIQNEDLYSGNEDQRKKEDDQMDMLFTLGINQAMEYNKEYTLYCRFWDKLGDGYILIFYKFIFTR